MKFTESFELEFEQAELDFVDVDVDRDTPLFIDPFAFSQLEDEWSIACHNSIVSFFDTALNLIRAGDERRAKALLNNLHEPNETCFGLSVGTPQGRGIGGAQAIDLYDKLADSQAAQTGILSELSDCELLIPGIGRDKISDITTNIIRNHLIEYTQAQCDVLGIELRGTRASGRIWDVEQHRWTQTHTQIPVVGWRKILLVPKASVRWDLSLLSPEYYNRFILDFLQSEHLNAHTGLVEVLRDGRRRVTKTKLKEHYPMSKDLLYEYTRDHPELLERYKAEKSTQVPVGNRELDQELDESLFADLLIQRLQEIPPGREHADEFHRVMVGALEFLFYPNLIYPKREHPIHGGRKRIDITYTNAAALGFFYRIHTAHNIRSNWIMVECKNYSSDPSNPELDQLLGRFSPNRGKLGLLIARTFDNRDLFIARCRDAALDDHGFVIPLVDDDIIGMLENIKSHQRNQIDAILQSILGRLLS